MRKRAKSTMQAIAERDEAIAERDYILRFLLELGAALNADAVAAGVQLLALRAMVRLGEG
jgi:hypothetical protein